MAIASANIHLDAGDAPTVSRLEGTQMVALWLTRKNVGPALLGTPEQLHEIRRAIGAFLFPEELEDAA